MRRFAAVMAGGSGTRFWPKSTKDKPKQLLALTGKRSLLQMTLDRLRGVTTSNSIVIITTKNLAKATKSQAPKALLLREPEGRNTMAAVCWAAWECQNQDPEATLAVLPADAYIGQEEAYRQTLLQAYDVAEKQNHIVCIGIKPRYAATGYGYIEAGSNLTENARSIIRFIEKPDAARANTFFTSGTFFWNAGIFVFKAAAFIEETRKHAPAFARAFEKIYTVKSRPQREAMLNRIYSKLPSVPVDIALMEKTSAGAVLSGDFNWNDLGSWTALEEVLPSNAPVGLNQAQGQLIALESSTCLINTSSKKFVGLIGVKDLIVVETDKALLICAKEKAQDIKKLVAEIEKNKKLRKELL